MTKSNMPEGKIAVMLTREQLNFLIHNAEVNETQLSNSCLKIATSDDPESMKDMLLKFDALRTQFRDVLEPLREASHD